MTPSEAQLRLIIDTIPVLACSKSPDSSAEFFNRRWLDYTGLSIARAQDLGWKASLHPDELEKVLACCRSTLASDQPGDFSYRPSGM